MDALQASKVGVHQNHWLLLYHYQQTQDFNTFTFFWQWQLLHLSLLGLLNFLIKTCTKLQALLSYSPQIHAAQSSQDQMIPAELQHSHTCQAKKETGW